MPMIFSSLFHWAFLALPTAVLLTRPFLALSSKSCNFSNTFASSPIIVGGIGDSGTRGMRNLLELLGVRVCPATGKTGDDDPVQRVSHRILYRSIFPHVEAKFEALHKKNQHSFLGRGNVSSSSLWFTSDPALRPGALFPLAGDPYEAFTRAVVSHPTFRLGGSEESTHLCDAVARSYECAASATTAGATVGGLHMDPALKALLLVASKNSSSVLDKRPGLPGGAPEPLAAGVMLRGHEERAIVMPWGFKEPRSAMVLKEFDELLTPPPSLSSTPLAFGGGGGPKFLHVIRDGRDIAFGDLRLITSMVCTAYFEGYARFIDYSRGHVARQAASSPLGKACAAKGRNQLVAWALLNEAIADEALQRFGRERYLAVRIEDIALDPDPAPTIRRILDFLGIFQVAPPAPSASTPVSAATPAPGVVVDEGALQQAVAAVAARIKGKYAGAYGGAKHGDRAARETLLARLRMTPLQEQEQEQSQRWQRHERSGQLQGSFDAPPAPQNSSKLPCCVRHRGRRHRVRNSGSKREQEGGTLLADGPNDHDHIDDDVPTSGATSTSSGGDVESSENVECEDLVRQALNRFGYTLSDWGLRSRAWSASDH